MKSIEEKLAIHKATEDTSEHLSDDKQIRKETVEISKCNFCKFESYSKKGVQIHIKKKHGKSFVTNVRKFLKVRQRRVYI